MLCGLRSPARPAPRRCPIAAIEPCASPRVRCYATNFPLLAALLREIAADRPALASKFLVFDATRRASTDDVLADVQFEHLLVLPGGRDARATAATGFAPYIVRTPASLAHAAAELVVEYSRPNIEHLRRSGASVDRAVYVPPLLWPYEPGVGSGRRIRFLVTFAGHSRTPRRADFLRSCRRAGLDVVAVGNASTAASLRALLDSTQILINVHTTAHHHTLEEYRVLPALLRGCVVVSEDVPLAREVPYADSIVFAPYERLVATAARVGREYASAWAATHGPTLGATLKAMRAEARRALEARLLAISQHSYQPQRL